MNLPGLEHRFVLRAPKLAKTCSAAGKTLDNFSSSVAAKATTSFGKGKDGRFDGGDGR